MAPSRCRGMSSFNSVSLGTAPRRMSVFFLPTGFLLFSGFLLGDLLAFLARLGQPDRDRLLAAFHRAALAAFAAFELALLLAVHGALDLFAGALAVSSHQILLESILLPNATALQKVHSRLGEPQKFHE